MYLTPGEDMQHASSFQEMPRKFKRHHFDSHQMFFHFVNLVGDCRSRRGAVCHLSRFDESLFQELRKSHEAPILPFSVSWTQSIWTWSRSWVKRGLEFWSPAIWSCSRSAPCSLPGNSFRFCCELCGQRRPRAPQLLQEALCTAFATQKAAAGQRRPRAPQLH